MNLDLRGGERELTRKGPEGGKPQNARGSEDAAAKPSVDELARLLRDLHQLLESYAPRWYSARIDSQLRKTLAKVNWATGKKH